MSYARRDIRGGAVQTTISSGITSGATSCAIVSSTGWPDGNAGPFYVVIDPGLTTEEKILCASRTSLSITITTRGADGSTASAHASGAAIYPVMVAVDADEANYTVSQTVGKVTTAGDLLVGSAANALARLGKGSNSTVLQVDSGGTLQWGTVTSAMTTDATLVNADINGSAAIALSKLATDPLARENHTGTQLSTTVSDFTEAAQDAVGAMATNGVGVTLAYSDPSATLTAELADAVAGAGLTIGSKVLAVGAGTGISVAADSVAVDSSVISTGAWTSFTPTLTQSGAVSKTVTYAKYARVGRTIIVNVKLSVTGSGSSGSDIVAGLPVTAATSGTPFCVGHGQVFDSGNARYGVTCDLVGTSTISFWRAGDASVPGGFVGNDPSYALASGDVITYAVMYEAAS